MAIIMVVNSISFWIFFIIVLVAYYGLFRRSAKLQNITLLMSSYVFYGMVDWKMCALLLFASVAFYHLGIAIAKKNGNNEKVASRLTTLGVLMGVGLLFYFKYLDFFVEQFGNLLSSIGLHNNINTFGILMPLGISFFTFKLIAYVVEVHRETIEPSKDFIAFGTFIAFFPTIMSGPIDQPGKFLPQLDTFRNATYDNFSEGTKRILWGMFLKMCIADQLSGYTSAVFGNYEHHNGTTLIIASILYYFQMYTDFAGYSDMAIGTSRILGLNISENFNRPIFAQNISEYWRRWHISLTSWITQYVYMPLNLAFRNIGMTGICLAAIINTMVIGAWHGANWTYILFGLYHGIFIALIVLVEKKRKKLEKNFSLKKKSWYKYSRMILTFVLVTLGMLMFRSRSIGEFYDIITSVSGFSSPFIPLDPTLLIVSMFGIGVLIAREYCYENKKNVHLLHSRHFFVRVISVALLTCFIISFGALNGGSFIYFQF